MQQQTYLIQIIDTDLFKIGKSKDPELRLSQLAQSQPYEYKLIAVCSKNIEAKLHKLFSKYSWHLGNSREWFKLGNQALRQVLMFYAEPSLLKKHSFKPESELSKASDGLAHRVKIRQKLITLTGFNDWLGEIYRYKLLHELLRDAMGDDWHSFGRPASAESVIVNNEAVYTHSNFADIRLEWKKENAKDNRWFWQIVMKQFLALKCTRYGKGRTKHKILNDIQI